MNSCNLFAEYRNIGIYHSIHLTWNFDQERAAIWKLAIFVLSGKRVQNIVASSAAISACGKCHQWPEALQIMIDVQEQMGGNWRLSSLGCRFR